MLILGFSKLGNSKMIFIFILGSPQPPQGRLKGALGGHRGYIDVILILGFSIVGIQFRVPQTYKGAPWRWLGSEEG